MPEQSPEYFNGLAEACRRQAAVASTLGAREALLELAEDYMRKAARLRSVFDEFGQHHADRSSTKPTR